MNLRIISISFLSILLASFSYALPQEEPKGNGDLQRSTSNSGCMVSTVSLEAPGVLDVPETAEVLRKLPVNIQSQMLAGFIEKAWDAQYPSIVHKLYEIGLRLLPEDAFLTADKAICMHREFSEVEEILNYMIPEYLPANKDMLSRLLATSAITSKAIDIARQLIDLGATAQYVDLNHVVFLLSYQDTFELAEEILALPHASHERLHSSSDITSIYVKGIRTILLQKDAELLARFLKHVPSGCFNLLFYHLVIKTVTQYPNLECLQLLIENKWIDFSASPVYPGWLGGSTPIEAPATQHLIWSYLGANAAIGIAALDKAQFDFEEFEKCFLYLLQIKGIDTIPYGTAADLLTNWLYSYSIRPKNHPITGEQYRRIINLLREKMLEQKTCFQSSAILKGIQERDVRDMLVRDAISYLERSPHMQDSKIEAPNRNQRRLLEEQREKSRKKINEGIKALKTLLEPSQTAGSAVAASSSVRAKPAASRRAISPKQVRERPQGFASQLAAQKSAVLAQPARTSCADAAAASSSNSCAVTQTVSADPLAEARAARQEALRSLAQQEAREQRRDASRNSRYYETNDHALLPSENQPARASSVTRPARGASASHSRDTTPLDKRDATPQLRPLMLVKDTKVLRAYYDVLEQSGNEGALSKFLSLLKQLGSPETFWSAYKDFKQITARSKTGESVKIIEFRLNDELRVYFKVTAENKLVLFGNPHHLQTKKNN